MVATLGHDDHDAVFGFLRPCRHGACPLTLHARWSEHLCGLCLTLRDEAGQLARTTTHVDALVVSVLAEAQGIGGRRRAGPCPLRGMRPAPVVVGDGARLAASTALLLASDAVTDHVADGDGPFARRPAAGAGDGVATRGRGPAARRASGIGFDPVHLLAVPARQREAEAARAPMAAVTAPTEAAVGSALAHTAVLAGRGRRTSRPSTRPGGCSGGSRICSTRSPTSTTTPRTAGGTPLAATGTSRAGRPSRAAGRPSREPGRPCAG